MARRLSLTVVQGLGKHLAVDLDELEALLNASAKLAWKKPIHGTIILHLIGDQRMRKLNRVYRKQDRVTDVLSFGYLGEEFGDEVLGEIYLCVPQLRRQAANFGHAFRAELALLFVHGLLHIYGYDHQKLTEAQIMDKLQAKILGSFSKPKS